MKPFATLEDYEVRYGTVSDPDRINVMLADASAYIATQVKVVEGDADQARILVWVTCAVVHRAVGAGEYDGFSSISQGAGDVSASVNIYNPGGNFFLSSAERSALGISGMRVGMTDPYGCGEDEPATSG